jgi:polyisoprenoid-binding protein YceI
MTTYTKSTETTRWQIDPAHSRADFRVKHMMFSEVRGSFQELEGSLEIRPDDPRASRVSVEIAAASIETGDEDRDQHLRSGDFFAAEEHPTLRFESRHVESNFETPGDEFRVVGDLTIRGTTREVVLEATYLGEGTDPWGNARLGFSAGTTIDRRDFGLAWNQALEAGGVLVGHDVEIELQIQATLDEGEEEPREEGA